MQCDSSYRPNYVMIGDRPYTGPLATLCTMVSIEGDADVHDSEYLHLSTEL